MVIFSWPFYLILLVIALKYFKKGSYYYER